MTARRRLLVALASLALALLLLAGLEGGLRAAGIGDPAPGGSRLRYQQLDLPILRPRARPDGTLMLATCDPRLPYQAVLREKPAGGLRVLVFGESAVAGLGLSPNATFARGLEEMLGRALPGRPVEVLNLGIVALASRQIRELVAEASAAYDADLLVVYVGNNEFLELHAAKYAERRGNLGSRLRTRLADSNLVRALRGLASRGDGPLSVSEASEQEMRISESTLIQGIDVSPAEIHGVVERYEANLDAMAASAAGHGVPILFLAVASNWEWRGRSDLPANWLDALVESGGEIDDDDRREALRVLDAKLASVTALDRHELLYRRAVLKRALGDGDGARADYRAAMNADPHLRRALDAMNDRVRAVAERRGALFLDTVAELSREAQDGIVGFGEFYDYVHFTPRGALLVAARILATLREAGLVPRDAAFDADAFVRSRVEELARADRDSLSAGEWLGFGSDKARIADRDLWKYDKMLSGLDERIARDPLDFEALVYRGNARSFRQDGAAGAAADYRAALRLRPGDEVVRANLEALLLERAAE